MTDSSKTSIEYFNEQMGKFVNEFISLDLFSELHSILKDYYGELLGTERSNNDRYVKRYMEKMKDHRTSISQKDETMFSEQVRVFKNVDFSQVWNSGKLSDKNKEKVWEYLQILFVIGETIINDSDRIKNLVQSFQKFTSGEDVEEQESNEQNEMLAMLRNLSEARGHEPLQEELLENGLIGNLAKELADELSLDELQMNMNNVENVDDVLKNIMSGDNPMKFMNLLQTVGKKIQDKVESSELDQEKLIEEATTMMSQMGGGLGGGLFDNLLKNMGQGMVPPKQNVKAEVSNPHNGSSTRDRLRRKLEKRRQEQEQ